MSGSEPLSLVRKWAACVYGQPSQDMKTQFCGYIPMHAVLEQNLHTSQLFDGPTART